MFQLAPSFTMAAMLMLGSVALAETSDKKPADTSESVTNPDREGESGQWTPERMRNAKPMPLPQVNRPPFGSETNGEPEKTKRNSTR
jgi:hypothetical protein